MEEWDYPFPVKYLPLKAEAEDLRMAYMDVSPEGAAATQIIVLLHGKNFYGSYFEGTAKALSAAGWRVIIPAVSVRIGQPLINWLTVWSDNISLLKNRKSYPIL